DWSSDVCSSDLVAGLVGGALEFGMVDWCDHNFRVAVASIYVDILHWGGEVEHIQTLVQLFGKFGVGQGGQDIAIVLPRVDRRSGLAQRNLDLAGAVCTATKVDVRDPVAVADGLFVRSLISGADDDMDFVAIALYFVIYRLRQAHHQAGALMVCGHGQPGDRAGLNAPVTVVGIKRGLWQIDG